MTNQHPITPPPKLVREWLGTYFGTTIAGEVSEVELALATQAARWGADQELEACCNYFEDRLRDGIAKDLRATRRPKPPSLKEQALAQLDAIQLDLDSSNIYGANTDTIRKALETIND